MKKVALINEDTQLVKNIARSLQNTEEYVFAAQFKTLSEAREAWLNGEVDMVLGDLVVLSDFFTKPEKISHLAKSKDISAREHDIMVLLSKGRLYKEIAQIIGISLGSVKQYTHQIYVKLGATNKTEAINLYFDREI